MSSSVNPNQRSSLNNKVTRMESSNSVPSVVYTSRPVNIHGGTFHGGIFGSSIGSNSRSQSPMSKFINDVDDNEYYDNSMMIIMMMVMMMMKMLR